MELIATAADVLLLSVAFCGVLVAPTFCVPKFRLVGVRLTLPGAGVLPTVMLMVDLKITPALSFA